MTFTAEADSITRFELHHRNEAASDDVVCGEAHAILAHNATATVALSNELAPPSEAMPKASVAFDGN
jgi:hypothetical protein